jgi:hypothetical protein
MNPLRFAVSAVGGQAAAARICGVSSVAVFKWLKRGSLPRTEYTGKTDYSERLAFHAKGAFTAEWLKNSANPDKN